MNRIFGKKKETAPPPNLGDVGQRVDARVGNLDAKVCGSLGNLVCNKSQVILTRCMQIKQLENELRDYQKKVGDTCI
jgi:hypothetical protein